MKIKEASELYRALLSDSFKTLKGAKLNYALIRNQAILKTELSMLENRYKPDPDFFNFSRERSAMLQELSRKDDKGKPVIENDNYQIDPKKEEEYKKRIEELQERYKDTLDKRDRDIKEFDDLMDEEIACELHRFPLEIIPEDITKEQMEALLPLIIE